MGGHARAGSTFPDRWLQLAIGYLARWDRTSVQVVQYLRTKGASSAQAKQVLVRLTDLRYLNDQAYAERWVENRLRLKPMGRERLLAELQAKGIGEVLAAEVVGQALRAADVEALARRALARRQGKGKRLTSAQARYLLHQRGFENDLIDRMIERVSDAEDMSYDT